MNAKVLTIELTDANGAPITTLSGAVIRINGLTGYQELTANALGVATFTGSLNDKLLVSIDRFVQVKNGFSYTTSNYVADTNFIETYLDTNKAIRFVLRSNS